MLPTYFSLAEDILSNFSQLSDFVNFYYILYYPVLPSQQILVCIVANSFDSLTYSELDLSCTLPECMAAK